MKVYASPPAIAEPKFVITDGGYDSEATRAEEARYFAELTTWLRANNFDGELTGEIVRFPIADGYAAYMVADNGSRSLALVHCPIGDAWSIPEAHARGLRKADIVAMIDRNASVRALFAASDDWWADQPVGAVRHYHNGFGEYVRGVIVDLDGKHQLRPTGLVGDWSHHPEHGDRIMAKREPWQPSTSCMFEAPGFSGPRGPMADFDPTHPEAGQARRLVERHDGVAPR